MAMNRSGISVPCEKDVVKEYSWANVCAALWNPARSNGEIQISCHHVLVGATLLLGVSVVFLLLQHLIDNAIQPPRSGLNIREEGDPGAHLARRNLRLQMDGSQSHSRWRE